MEVIAFDPYVSANDASWQDTKRIEHMSELLPQADIVNLHVPLNEWTRHLINAETLTQMKTGAILLNAARGGTVDEKALVEAIKSGQLSGATLDVFETDPLTESATAHFTGVSN